MAQFLAGEPDDAEVRAYWIVWWGKPYSFAANCCRWRAQALSKAVPPGDYMPEGRAT
jgi:hypothetical protein